MHRIADIKQRREDRFWENRMKLAKVQKQDDIHREVSTHGHLLEKSEKKEELISRVRERVVAREEEKQEKKKLLQKGKMMVEEEEL